MAQEAPSQSPVHPQSCKSYLRSACILYDLWNAALQRKNGRGLFDVTKWPPPSCGDIIFNSEETIHELLDNFHFTHFSVQGNRPARWIFYSNTEGDVAALSSRLDHIKDHQHEECDQTFQQNIDRLRNRFDQFDIQQLQFVHHIDLEPQQYTGINGSSKYSQFRQLVDMKAEVICFPSFMIIFSVT